MNRGIPPWVDPDSPAAERWREIREEGDLERLASYEEILWGPPGFCTSAWRSEMDVAERFSHVPDDSRAARAWRTIQEKGDGWGLKRLEGWIEALETTEELARIPFCDCGCGRVKGSAEFALNPGTLLVGRSYLEDGTLILEKPQGVWRIIPPEEEP